MTLKLIEQFFLKNPVKKLKARTESSADAQKRFDDLVGYCFNWEVSTHMKVEFDNGYYFLCIRSYDLLLPIPSLSQIFPVFHVFYCNKLRSDQIDFLKQKIANQ